MMKDVEGYPGTIFIFTLNPRGRRFKCMASALNIQHCVYIIIFLFAVLCAERLTQMTRTYNDIEAVTRLLEEVSIYI